MMAETRRCAHCGAEFKPYREHHRFCPGGRCRMAAWMEEHPRVTRRKRPEPRPVVLAMVEALKSMRREP